MLAPQENLRPIPKDLNIVSMNLVHGGLIEIHMKDEDGQPFLLCLEPGKFFAHLGFAHQKHFESIFNPQFDALYRMLEPADRKKLGIPEPPSLKNF
jgi:hypothetical protein